MSDGTVTLQSRHVKRAYADIRRNLALLSVCALMNSDAFQKLPPDDFFRQAAAGLDGMLRVSVQRFVDGPEESFHEALPIYGPGPKHIVLAFAATAAGLLLLLGHTSVGIAVVNASGRGVCFKVTSHEDIVCREVKAMHPAGGVS